MTCRDQSGPYRVREDVRAPQARNALVERPHVRQPPAKHDDVWVEHVDHGRECSCHALLVACQRLLRAVIAR